MDKESKVVDLPACARCGEGHDKLLFKPLTNPLDNFEYWSLCPTTGEPILMWAIQHLED